MELVTKEDLKLLKLKPVLPTRPTTSHHVPPRPATGDVLVTSLCPPGPSDYVDLQHLLLVTGGDPLLHSETSRETLFGGTCPGGDVPLHSC